MSLGWDEAIVAEVGFRSCGFSKEVTFEQKCHCEGEPAIQRSGRRTFQAEEKASIKALRKNELGSSDSPRCKAL